MDGEKSARPLVFVDTETTGLDPARHEVYEIALTKVDDDGCIVDDRYFWVAPLRLHHAENAAIQIGQFYKRQGDVVSAVVGDEQRYEAAVDIASFTEGCHLLGAQPDFDAGFLDAFLRDNSACPAWHHRLIDIESLAIGLIVGEAHTWGRPMSLSDICEALDIPRTDAHTARADCEQVRVAYFMLMEMAEQRDNLWRGEQPTETIRRPVID